ncbi:MAG: hypothetical protein ACMXYB_05495 [Candidatus Woesearchaeota archaeon]
MIKSSITLILTLLFITSIYSLEPPFEIWEDIREEFYGNVNHNKTNTTNQDTLVDTSEVLKNMREELSKDVNREVNTTTQDIQVNTSNVLQNIREELEIENQRLLNSGEDDTILTPIEYNIEPKKITDNIIFIAGYGIIVITLIGIVILYSLHFFRKKRRGK